MTCSDCGRSARREMRRDDLQDVDLLPPEVLDKSAGPRPLPRDNVQAAACGERREKITVLPRSAAMVDTVACRIPASRRSRSLTPTT